MAQECFLAHPSSPPPTVASCARSKWSRRLTSHLSLKYRIAAANSSHSHSHPETGRHGGGGKLDDEAGGGVPACDHPPPLVAP